jgi:hypothetical protein
MSEENKPKFKVGDRLAFRYYTGLITWQIWEIERITPTGRYVCGPYTINPDLSIRGGKEILRRCYRAQAVTPEILALYERQQCLSTIQHTDFKRLGNEFLKQICNIIKDSAGRKSADDESTRNGGNERIPEAGILETESTRQAEQL